MRIRVSNRNISLLILLLFAIICVCHFPVLFETHQIVFDSYFDRIEHSIEYYNEQLQSWPFSQDIDAKSLANSFTVSELHRKSLAINSTLLIPIFITEDYVPVFFNWVSHILLQNSSKILRFLIVIPMDNVSCSIIHHFRISHLCINPSDFFEDLNCLEFVEFPLLGKIFSVRMICFWLLSVWGFDIINFDVDAIPVRPNFIDLFLRENNADLVAGVGTFPMSSYAKLGATVCMGTFYLKSLTKSEGVRELFRKMRTIETDDDQVKMNKALVSMGVYWESRMPGKVWQGWDSSKKLSVIFLPQNMICRKVCRHFVKIRGTPRDKLYMMHPIGEKTGPSKKRTLQATNLWNLKPNANVVTFSSYNLDLIEFVEDLF